MHKTKINIFLFFFKQIIKALQNPKTKYQLYLYSRLIIHNPCDDYIGILTLFFNADGSAPKQIYGSRGVEHMIQPSVCVSCKNKTINFEVPKDTQDYR